MDDRVIVLRLKEVRVGPEQEKPVKGLFVERFESIRQNPKTEMCCKKGNHDPENRNIQCSFLISDQYYKPCCKCFSRNGNWISGAFLKWHLILSYATPVALST